MGTNHIVSILLWSWKLKENLLFLEMTKINIIIYRFYKFYK